MHQILNFVTTFIYIFLSLAKVIRTRYSATQKKKIADYARFHGCRAAARHFKIHHRNAERWLKEELHNTRHRHRPRYVNKKGQGRKISYPSDLELELLQWVLEKREAENIPVSIQALKLKALSLIMPVLPNFKASDGWARGFLKRNENKIYEFRRKVKQINESGDFPYELIGNMDETPAYLDMVPSRTLDVKGKKTKMTKS